MVRVKVNTILMAFLANRGIEWENIQDVQGDLLLKYFPLYKEIFKPGHDDFVFCDMANNDIFILKIIEGELESESCFGEWRFAKLLVES